MAVKVRASISNGGPHGNDSSWDDEGFVSALCQSKTVISVAANQTDETIVKVIPPAGLIVGGARYQDVLGADNVIQGLYGVYMTPFANWAANVANLTVQAVVRRAGALVGGSAVAGWAAAANPALTAWVPTFVPWLPANTALQPGVAGGVVGAANGNAWLPLQPLDVITIQLVAGGVAPTVPSVLAVDMLIE